MSKSRRAGLLVFIILGLLATSSPANAQIVVESFDNPTGANGQVLFRADAIYLATGASPSGGDRNGNSPYLNGYVLQNNNFPPFNPGSWGLISHDQSGTGYFLWEGTNTGSAPSYAGTFWESFTPISVSPNTTYDVLFYLVNSNAQGNYAIVQPSINGVTLGAGVSARGYYTDGISGDGWQKFDFSWDSGSATTADLKLVNLRNNNIPGDDFGVDMISLTPVPEPSSMMLSGIVGLAVLARAKAGRRTAGRRPQERRVG
jgi:PEP-CTERM motif